MRSIRVPFVPAHTVIRGVHQVLIERFVVFSVDRNLNQMQLFLAIAYRICDNIVVVFILSIDSTVFLVLDNWLRLSRNYL